MDVTVTGRKIQITDTFREAVEKKMAELDSRVDKVIRAEVQAQQTQEKRGTAESIRVEITLIGKGPVVRAEATADSKTAAFDGAFDHLKAQLRKAADRRREHRNLRKVGFVDPSAEVSPSVPPATEPSASVPVKKIAGLEIQGDGPMVVREKMFYSTPLTLAQALDEMELVGHDFFLYVDTDSALPSVVYRRKAYDYGVIHLKLSE
ncbi:MAG: ribosome-associated translation inhibitor RaiA [Propionibacteriaceae bacterium]|jgi:ribosomal subunit interface protein|nr:ribosome-associated translation inhibitor RaiA [Propionibacteriaceae bacterium]